MYETTFIVVPELSEMDYKKVAGKFEKLIKDSGCEIINVEHWGQQKLAYPVKRRTSGFYCYIEFIGEGDVIAKLEQEFIYDVQVIRYLTVRLDKYAQEYNTKRRAGSFNTDKKVEENK
ncbi:MAG: 30S ribosomal protein S6 [Bacteroidia bacterium]|nr:30S ribosomal protein S6 [Bacteroidia bacterium]